MMSIFEAAKYLGISVFSLRKLARESRLPAGKVGRQWRFRQEDLDAFLKQQYGGIKDAA
jgi:excisionase family DNA binding protein